MTTATTIQTNNKGFTLIELLVVIAIIGVLAAVVLLAINPAEILRKSRDSTRFSDLTTLRKGIDAALADGTATNFPQCPTSGGCSSASASPGRSAVTSGTSSWITAGTANTLNPDLSKYIPTLPIDPSNNASITAASGATKTAAYYYVSTTLGYKLSAYVESTANISKAANDGGTVGCVAATTTSACGYETGTDMTASVTM